MIRHSITAGSVCFPVEIHVENRRNVRGSVGKRAVYIRLPRSLSPSEREQHIRRLMKWAREALERRPPAPRAAYRQFRDGECFTIDGREYVLRISSKDKKSSSARLTDGTLKLCLSSRLEGVQRDRATAHLVSRCIARERLPALEKTIRELNRRHFGRKINRIRFKYNRSTWGSCSARDNVNISTRLLFAPRDVLVYVCIHELAHLVEMNHSPRFWKLVKRTMPDYRDKILWLERNGDKLWF